MNDLIPLILFAISTALTPGPNNFMLMNSGLHFGIKKSLAHYLGISLGFPLMVLIVALGLGVVFEKYPVIKLVLKILGSIYMLYLAWQILISSQTKGTTKKKPLSFIQAALFQWVNPKAWIMAVGTISIFSITNNEISNALLISFIYFLVGIPCIGAWLVCGHYLQRILKTETHRKWFNIIMALGLIVSIVMILVD